MNDFYKKRAGTANVSVVRALVCFLIVFFVVISSVSIESRAEEITGTHTLAQEQMTPESLESAETDVQPANSYNTSAGENMISEQMSGSQTESSEETMAAEQTPGSQTESSEEAMAAEQMSGSQTESSEEAMAAEQTTEPLDVSTGEKATAEQTAGVQNVSTGENADAEHMTAQPEVQDTEVSGQRGYEDINATEAETSSSALTAAEEKETFAELTGTSEPITVSDEAAEADAAAESNAFHFEESPNELNGENFSSFKVPERTAKYEKFKIAYVDADSLRIRKDAGTQYKEITQISYSTVVITGEKKDKSGNLWYQINYGGTIGYICAKQGNTQYVKNIEEVSVDISALNDFPESYRSRLTYLMAMNPRFTFVADYLDYTLDEAAKWHVGKKTNAGSVIGVGTIKTYMDPLTYLNPSHIYVFAVQDWNKTQDKEGLTKMFSAGTAFLDTDSYKKALLNAGKKTGVSPYVLAATVLLEKGWQADLDNPDVYGREVSTAIVKKNNTEVFSGPGIGYDIKGKITKGTVYVVSKETDPKGNKWYQIIYQGYPGYIRATEAKNLKYFNTYYNLFSINQSDDNVVVGGITYAMKQGWTTAEKSLAGGAVFYRNGYMSNGQNTYYYKDFNVINDQSNWWHEYAGGITSPMVSARILGYAYRGDRDAELIIRIPVYKNLESEVEVFKTPEEPVITSVTNTKNGVKIKWTGVENARKYRVYRKTDGKWKAIVFTTGKSYVDTETEMGVRYKYAVKAFNGETSDTAGKMSNKKAIIYKPKLSRPKISMLRIKNKKAVIRWSAVEKAGGYKIYRRISGKTKWSTVATLRNPEKLRYADKNVKRGRTYEYTIKAFATGGGTSSYSKASKISRLIVQ